MRVMHAFSYARFGTGDEEEGQAKATVDGQHHGGHGRERNTTRADAGRSCVEATRPHTKCEKTRTKKKKKLNMFGK